MQTEIFLYLFVTDLLANVDHLELNAFEELFTQKIFALCLRVHSRHKFPSTIVADLGNEFFYAFHAR
jgi:hypothetical protein